uniref:Antifreeze protein Afp1 n=1 Tax=Glaciozyma antarctica TaxID=105987 RepID=D0EKL2_9BASI|nr:antifreeze protein Afp1 [Glaciozyma antarctica]
MRSNFHPLAASFIVRCAFLHSRRFTDSLFQLLSSLISLTSAATAIDLGVAGQYDVVARSAITLGALAEITGNVGLSPGLSTALTGFTLVPVEDHGTFCSAGVKYCGADSLSTSATSLLVKGRIDAPDFPSSPAILGQAATDVVAAWKSAFSQELSPADYTKRDFAGGLLSDLTLAPG